MVEATEIEKHSLEAHVELCAERYNALEDKLSVLDTKISGVSAMVKEVKEATPKYVAPKLPEVDDSSFLDDGFDLSEILDSNFLND